MTFMRSLLASVAGYLVATAVGCAGAPDSLRSALALNAATAAAIDVAIEGHNDRVRADFQRRAARCPPPPVEGRDACLFAAGAETLTAFGPEATRLRELQLWQHTGAEALAVAQQCREGGLACESAELARAQGPLASARAGLTVLDAGAGGAP